MKSLGGQRNTRQKQAILDALRSLTSHPTASELHQRLRRGLPRLSLGTVYRNLERLAQSGEIRKLPMNGLEARFDGNRADHHHLSCDQCGRIVDLYDIPVKVDDQVPQNAVGWQVTGYHLDFVGLCPNCQTQPQTDVDALPL